MYEWRADKEKQKALFGELWQFIEDDEVTDINYNCGSRGQHRDVFSNDGLIFVTKNHYKSFEKK